MNPSLAKESERLARSWQRHDAVMLRDYLVADVEDPRLNVQSVLSRHFLAFSLFGSRFRALADQELRFAACLNWVLNLSKDAAANPEAIHHALRVGADNGEGVEIPGYIVQAFRTPPAAQAPPPYLVPILEAAERNGRFTWPPPGLDTFADLWQQALASESPGQATVVEPACGSANDYRCLERNGLARLIDYTGFDLAPKNIANARELFPAARFEVGNAFAIAAPDRAFDLCFAHDLFEHLSPAGIERAATEIGRVTRAGACLGFFNMDEAPDHFIQPVDEYHWNRLSMERLRALFVRQGFAVQVMHVGALLQSRVGCRTTHNTGAYTFILGREPAAAPPGGLDAAGGQG